MENCPECSTFISKSEDEKLPSLFNEKVGFPSLKNLYICDVNKSKIFITADVFGELEVIYVYKCNNLTKIFTSNLQRTLGSLRRLTLHDCEMVEEVFEIQTSSIEEITHDTIPSQLIYLSLWALPKLEYVWGKDPRGTLTFTHLEDVRVLNCPSLKSMFPFSVAKGLAKLRQLLLRDCGIEKIVEAVGTTVAVPPEFVFPQLEKMKLESLENLVCFYRGLHTSSWPSLTSLVVKRCEKVKVWASELSSFQEKHVLHDHDSSPIPQPFIFTKVAFPSLLTLEIEGLAELKMIWQYKLSSADSFSKLEDVKVRDCNNLVKIFPSSMQRRLNNLKRLEIHCCKMVEEVFEIQIMPNVEEVTSSSQNEDLVGDREECAGALSRLSGLRLYNMPNLLHSREESSQPQTVFQNLTYLDILRCGRIKKLVSSSISFPNLVTLKVEQCHGMPYLLTSQTARSMVCLKSLILFNCKRMAEIIVDAEKGEDMEGEIVLARLKTLILDCLPSLTSFYSGKYMLGFPDLENVIVSGCFEMLSFSKHGNIVSTPKLHKLVTVGADHKKVDDINTIMAVNTPMDLNTIIPELWKSHPGTVLQQLFCGTDLTLSNLSVEQPDI